MTDIGSSTELRVVLRTDVQLGPGKADLLQGIQELGSIAAAGRRIGMSYKRAWYLIDTLNGYFPEPLVVATKGGTRGGGAELTATGKVVLDSYRRMQAKTARAIRADLEKLQAMSDPVPARRRL